MIELKNEYLQLTIDDVGAQPCSLKDIRNDCEILWRGDPEFWGYHDPVLFPFIGNFRNDHYRYKGKTIKLGQHGFARTKPFRLKERTGISAVYVLEADAGTKEVYPFDFRFTVRQSIDGNRFITEWIVENTSEKEPMFFSVGAHPAFNVPLNDGERKDECYILFPGKEELTYILKDPDRTGAVPQKKYRMELDGGYLKTVDHLFDIDTFIFEDGQIEEVSLCGADRRPYVTVKCEGFPFFGIWTKSDAAPFICLEPWYGRLDDADFCGELPEKTGIIELKAGEKFTAEYTIVVEQAFN